MSSTTQKIDLNSKNDLSDEEYENLDTDTVNDTELDEDEIGIDDEELGDEDEDVEEDFEASENLENIKTDSNDMFEDEDDDIFDYNDIDTEIAKDLKVPENERTTIPRLTKYERVRLLGTRAKQISDGSKVFIKSTKVKTAMDIAELELEYKVIPLKIKRPLPNGRYEIWSIKELEI
jgi:DNA-directed RNA polymerase I, II, and III subunit RPABC2